MRKALRRELPRYIDLIQYLKDRGYVSTSGEAEKLILDGRVRSESHKLGIGQETQPKRLSKAALLVSGGKFENEVVDVVRPHVPASLRKTIRVIDA